MQVHATLMDTYDSINNSCRRLATACVQAAAHAYSSVRSPDARLQVFTPLSPRAFYMYLHEANTEYDAKPPEDLVLFWFFSKKRIQKNKIKSQLSEIQNSLHQILNRLDSKRRSASSTEKTTVCFTQRYL